VSATRREHGGAGAVLSGEAGEDAAEEVVGEATDAVDSFTFLGGGAGQGGGNRDRRLGEEAVDEVEHHLLVDVQRPRIQPVPHQCGRCVIRAQRTGRRPAHVGGDGDAAAAAHVAGFWVATETELNLELPDSGLGSRVWLYGALGYGFGLDQS